MAHLRLFKQALVGYYPCPAAQEVNVASGYKITRQRRFINDEPNEEPTQFLRDTSGNWTPDETEALSLSDEDAQVQAKALRDQDVQKEYIFDYSSVSE